MTGKITHILTRKTWPTFLLVLLASILALWPAVALADGGPIVEPSLFARLKEGQQVAVVTIKDTQTVSVDLFASILDQTGESHDITYFVPLGYDAKGLSVRETDSLSFSETYTNDLDVAIFRYSEQSRQFVETLFAGALLANGAWLAPIWVPLLLTSCSGEPSLAPVSTFETESSEVSVFDVSDDTDVDALASTAGLDPSVSDSLARVRGQQIAVVRLHTVPHSSNPGSSGESQSGEPGLHLSWTTSLVSDQGQPTYAYPLSTGAAWAQPIEMTRVYVVAPSDLHFSVTYPRLGINRPGTTVEGHRYVPLITGVGNTPAYAAEMAALQTTDARYPAMPRKVTVWRGTYANSNAAEDIIITVKEGSALTAVGQRLRHAGEFQALLLGVIVAAIFWVLAWWFLMPRLLGHGVRASETIGLCFGFLGWNLLLFIPGAFFYLISTMSAANGLEGLVITVPLFALAGAFMTSRVWHKTETISKRRVAGSVAVVTAVSGAAYILVVLAFARLAGVM